MFGSSSSAEPLITLRAESPALPGTTAAAAGTASSRSSRAISPSPAATGLVSSAHANALLTSMLLTPRTQNPSKPPQPPHAAAAGFSDSDAVSAVCVLDPDTTAGGGGGGSSSRSPGFWRGIGTALRLNPASSGTPALRVTGAAAVGDMAGAAAAAAAAAVQPPAAAMAALLMASADDNSQAKPVYSSGLKGPSAASDLVLMCRRLWRMAWPLCWMEVLAFAKELIITSYVGHLGAAELSALVLAQTVYNVTGNAPMLGFVTAMETFCGQAFGAQRYKMVGLVLQRGLVISFMYCCVALWTWQFNGAVLVWMGQDPGIAAAAHKLTLALGPALFLDAADQCCRRYLSAQAVVQPLMVVTCAATLLTPLYLWLFIGRMKLGLVGAAVAWDAVQATSLAFMALCCYRHTKSQPPSRCTWPGWSRDAFREWRSYIRMALPSCVMICLDWWTFEVIVMLSGLLPRPEQTMSMMGITFNIHALCFFAAHGLSGAASTRVGNDLGAGRPHMAWLTVQVAVLLGTVVMCVSTGVLLLSRSHVGQLFSSEHSVVLLTAQAVPPLAVSLIGEGANTVLAGVMRGCGRQRIGATINLVTYWLFGLPVACLLAFPGKLGALGLWTGLACTASVQALLMSLTVFRFNWVNEAARAKALVAAGELVLEDEPASPHSGDPFSSSSSSAAAAAALLPGAAAGLQQQHAEGVMFHRGGQHKQQQQQQQQLTHSLLVDAERVGMQQQQQLGRHSPLDHRLQVE